MIDHAPLSTAAREIAFEAFDATWSKEHDRPTATFGGARQTFYNAGYRQAMDAAVATRTDVDTMRSEMAALEDHVSRFGDCQRQMFLGDCAECEQYGRLNDRVLALGTDEPS